MNWNEIKEKKIMLLGKKLFLIEITNMNIIKKKLTFHIGLIFEKQCVEVHEWLPLHNIL